MLCKLLKRIIIPCGVDQSGESLNNSPCATSSYIKAPPHEALSLIQNLVIICPIALSANLRNSMAQSLHNINMKDNLVFCCGSILFSCIILLSETEESTTSIRHMVTRLKDGIIMYDGIITDSSQNPQGRLRFTRQ